MFPSNRYYKLGWNERFNKRIRYISESNFENFVTRRHAPSWFRSNWIKQLIFEDLLCDSTKIFKLIDSYMFPRLKTISVLRPLPSYSLGDIRDVLKHFTALRLNFEYQISGWVRAKVSILSHMTENEKRSKALTPVLHLRCTGMVVDDSISSAEIALMEDYSLKLPNLTKLTISVANPELANSLILTCKMFENLRDLSLLIPRAQFGGDKFKISPIIYNLNQVPSTLNSFKIVVHSLPQATGLIEIQPNSHKFDLVHVTEISDVKGGMNYYELFSHFGFPKLAQFYLNDFRLLHFGYGNQRDGLYLPIADTLTELEVNVYCGMHSMDVLYDCATLLPFFNQLKKIGLGLNTTLSKNTTGLLTFCIVYLKGFGGIGEPATGDIEFVEPFHGFYQRLSPRNQVIINYALTGLKSLSLTDQQFLKSFAETRIHNISGFTDRLEFDFDSLFDAQSDRLSDYEYEFYLYFYEFLFYKIASISQLTLFEGKWDASTIDCEGFGYLLRNHDKLETAIVSRHTHLPVYIHKSKDTFFEAFKNCFADLKDLDCKIWHQIENDNPKVTYNFDVSVYRFKKSFEK